MTEAYFAAIATDRSNGDVSADLTGTYGGRLVKVNGLWLISRWQIASDGRRRRQQRRRRLICDPGGGRAPPAERPPSC